MNTVSESADLFEEIDRVFFATEEVPPTKDLLLVGDLEFEDLTFEIEKMRIFGRRVFSVMNHFNSLPGFTPQGITFILGNYLEFCIASKNADVLEYVLFFLSSHEDCPEDDSYSSAFTVEEKRIICRFIDEVLAPNLKSNSDIRYIKNSQKRWCLNSQAQ